MGGESPRRDPLFGAAVLKVSVLERGPGESKAFREIYDGVLADLGITDAQVNAYLDAHRAEVMEALAGQSRK